MDIYSFAWGYLFQFTTIAIQSSELAIFVKKNGLLDLWSITINAKPEVSCISFTYVKARLLGLLQPDTGLRKDSKLKYITKVTNQVAGMFVSLYEIW